MSPTETLNLALQLVQTLTAAGEAATQLSWFGPWAESLTATQLAELSAEQLSNLVSTLAQVSSSSSSNTSSSSSSSNSSSSSSYIPSQELLGMVCLQLGKEVGVLSAVAVVGTVNALAQLSYIPFDQSLLPSLAARAAEKMPVLTAGQCAALLVNFSQLGCSIGEPLQSKLMVKLQSAVNSSISELSLGSSAAVAELLTALLFVCEKKPDQGLVDALVQAVGQGLEEIRPPRVLVELLRVLVEKTGGFPEEWVAESNKLLKVVAVMVPR
jgi:hypothetical protein